MTYGISGGRWCALLCIVPVLAACTTKPAAVAPSAQPATTEAPASPAIESSILPGSAKDFQVNVGDTVHFDYDRSDLGGGDRSLLQRQAAWLNKYPAVRVMIEGHCDERGTRAYNLALGARRAEVVKQYLEENGVTGARMGTISYGKERPVCAESTETCWAQNRRAVTTVSARASS